ncbi:HIT family protein [Paenibacillus solisilvae]|uniref:HIT family protein n=1 Tax=Paenibacillus solisilvae TaxID=2486751 RepID=A0ABW0W704_9BACL
MSVYEDKNCYYCRLSAGPDESEHFIRFWTSLDSVVYLHRDQSLPGRVVVASVVHAEDLSELTSDQYTAFFDTVRRISQVISSAFPLTEKINLYLCGNNGQFRHPHMHVLPRFTGDRSWPDFISDFQQPYWPTGDPRYEEVISALHQRLMMEL